MREECAETLAVHFITVLKKEEVYYLLDDDNVVQIDEMRARKLMDGSPENNRLACGYFHFFRKASADKTTGMLEG